MNKIYKKITNFISINKLFALGILVSTILIIPIFIVAPSDRATGDDLGYSLQTHYAWDNTHSITSVMKASINVVKGTYQSHQGTYSSVFLFSLQPEVFSPKAYVITPYIMISLWLSSTIFLVYKLLSCIFRFSFKQSLLISIPFWIISMEFVPKTYSTIFWYNGCVHYIVPYSVTQFVLGIIIQFLLKKQSNKNIIIYTIFSSLIFFLICGASYQVPMYLLLFTFFVSLYTLLINKSKTSLVNIIPLFVGTIGLLISIKAPGNANRSSAVTSFSIQKILSTVLRCFKEGFLNSIKCLSARPLVAIGLIVLFVIILECFITIYEKNPNLNMSIKLVPLVVVLICCINCAIEAPLIYADILDSTTGPINMYYLYGCTSILQIEFLLANEMAKTIYQKIGVNNYHSYITIPIIAFACFLVLVFKHDIKSSVSYICWDYYSSGQAADYKAQMDYQTELLLNSTGNVIVNKTNHIQGPICNMPAIEDPNNITNRWVANYYSLESVTTKEN